VFCLAGAQIAPGALTVRAAAGYCPPVFRLVFAVAIGFSISAASNIAAQTVAPQQRASIIYAAHDPQALVRFEDDPAIVKGMVRALVTAATGKADSQQAWRSLFGAKDRIGIKVASAGGRYFSSRVSVVEAILDGLETAGFPRREVIVWDRDVASLRRAGFDPKMLGCQVRGIEPIRGYDREATIAGPVLGRLIWGDVLFSEKAQKTGGRLPRESDQLSSMSHFASLVSREITRIINVPVISDEPGCGVAGAIYNLTVPNVDNWRRFTLPRSPGPEGLADIYADPRLGPKVALTFLDGLLAQYAGGPAANPNYAFPHRTLYASRDPVALDATALRLLEGWRKEAKLPAIGARAAWLESAAQAGLGNFAAERITIEAVVPPK
jgi:hypothetical protein